MIGMRYPYEVNLVGDAAATLCALLPLLVRKHDRSWRESVESLVARWWETMAMEAGVEADPINPMRLFAELNPRLPDNVIVTADSGSAANWYARQLRFRDGMRGSLSGTLATMGPGVPYGIGAKFGCPDRPVIVFAGDGAIVDYAGFAASLGLAAIAVNKPDDIAPAWERALAANRPTLLDVRCDPNVPPVPPHATLEQMTDAAKALLAGDEDRWGVVKEGVRTKLQEFLPHREG